MRTIAVSLCLLSGCASSTFAQVFTPTRPPNAQQNMPLEEELELVRAELELEQAKAEPDSQKREQAERSASDKIAKIQQERSVGGMGNERASGSFLTQAALQGIANETNPELSVQAAELYFNDTFRVYLRSTLSIDNGDDAQDEGTDNTQSSTSDKPGASALEDRIRSALLDPYGGLLYLTTGAFHPIFAKPVATGERPRGVFLDARTGIRAVQIDEQQSENNPVVPFATVSGGLVFQWPVWPKPTLSRDEDSVGDFVFGLTWVSNAVLDKTVSTIFSGEAPVLDRWTHTLALTAGISLKGLAKLTFTGNPWSSNSVLGKRFSVGLALVRDE